MAVPLPCSIVDHEDDEDERSQGFCPFLAIFFSVFVPLFIYRVYQVKCSLKNQFISASEQHIFILKTALKRFFIADFV